MKVRCIRTVEKEKFTKGKIYELTEEGIMNESGDLYTAFLKYKGSGLLEKWNDFYGHWGKFEEVKEMTKDDLKTGMIVEMRDGERFLVLGERLINLDQFENISNYDKNLLNKNEPECDILKIYQEPRTPLGFKYKLECSQLICIWERQEKSAAELELEKLKAEKEKFDREFNERLKQLEKEV